MLTTEQINDLHRLYWSEHWPIRKIERQLNIGWRTIRKYLDAPAQVPVHRDRPSKLDPFKGAIAEWLEKDPGVSAAVIEQKLRAAGYQGGHSILREYVRNARPHIAPKRAFVRMEPLAGERFEVDWGHFGALSYSGDLRKLYAFALVDAHSRMLYVEFTHSQSCGTFARCHVHAFTALGGIAREIAYDNLATAVVEHDGRLVRFLPRFLAFAREYGFYPHACNPASGWEKGKIERAIGYLRQNFWPLREFTDLHDVNRQVRQWSRTQAKTRILRLLDLTFLKQGTNLVLIGNPGVGKTFLARVFGWKACQANQRVVFTTAMDMLNHLLASQVDHSLVRKLKTFTEPTLLIVDELGYLSLDQQTSNLFYQVISTRHSQKRSTIITTNTPFSDWGNILFNTTIATAIADRLVENSEIFLLGGDSLRKAGRNSASPEE